MSQPVEQQTPAKSNALKVLLWDFLKVTFRLVPPSWLEYSLWGGAVIMYAIVSVSMHFMIMDNRGDIGDVVFLAIWITHLPCPLTFWALTMCARVLWWYFRRSRPDHQIPHEPKT